MSEEITRQVEGTIDVIFLLVEKSDILQNES